MKIRYQGPVKAPIAKRGDHIADLVVTTADSGEQVMPLVAAEAVERGGFLRPHLDRPQAIARHGLNGARTVHQPRRRGGGRQIDPARRAGRGARRARADRLVTREPGGSPGAEAIRELAARRRRRPLEPARRSLAVRRRAHRPCRQDHPSRRLLRGEWVLSDRFLDSSASPIRARPAGWASRRCATSTASGARTTCPTARLVLQLDEAEGRRARPRPRRPSPATASASRPPTYHAAVDAGFRHDGATRARAGQADRRQRADRDGHRALARRARRPAAVIHGHDRAVEQFLAAWRGEAMHHAWLLAGPRGVGKASFARAAARRMLAEAAGPAGRCPGSTPPPTTPIARLIAAGSHPDYRMLERIEQQDRHGARAQHQRRPGPRRWAICSRSRPSMSAWRAVVIDTADDLEAVGRQRLAQDARGAAGQLRVPARQPCPRALAADDPLALPEARLPAA